MRLQTAPTGEARLQTAPTGEVRLQTAPTGEARKSYLYKSGSDIFPKARGSHRLKSGT